MNAACRKAVWLLNYGGPRSEEEALPFLLELFSDPHIFQYPAWIRKRVANFIAGRRAPVLVSIYREMGMFSPIWEETRKQGEALQARLGQDYAVFTGMRYFPADMDDAARRIKEAGCGKVFLLPMFPQESNTTTLTCIDAAKSSLAKCGWQGSTISIRNFFREPGFSEAVLDNIRIARESVRKGPARFIFVAHGLPVKLALQDKYTEQVRETVKFLGDKLQLPVSFSRPAADAWQEGILAYQGKVGPMRWLEPSVENIIEEWGRGGCGSVIVVPVAFVSEHSETLYELDILYRRMAEEFGMEFIRVPTVSCHPKFIECLAGTIERTDND